MIKKLISLFTRTSTFSFPFFSQNKQSNKGNRCKIINQEPTIKRIRNVLSHFKVHNETEEGHLNDNLIPQQRIGVVKQGIPRMLVVFSASALFPEKIGLTKDHITKAGSERLADKHNPREFALPCEGTFNWQVQKGRSYKTKNKLSWITRNQGIEDGITVKNFTSTKKVMCFIIFSVYE